MNKAYLLAAVLGLAACQPNREPAAAEETINVEIHPGKDNEAPKGPWVTASQLVPYELGGKMVNSVDVQIWNPGSDTALLYTVTLIQGNDRWTDTLELFLEARDSLSAQLVFPESLFSEDKPASFAPSFEPMKP